MARATRRSVPNTTGGASAHVPFLAVSLLDTDELQVRTVTVRAADLVYLRSLLEASEGLGFFVAKKGGDVLLVSSHSLAPELDRFLADVAREIPMVVRDPAAYREAFDVLG